MVLFKFQIDFLIPCYFFIIHYSAKKSLILWAFVRLQCCKFRVKNVLELLIEWTEFYDCLRGISKDLWDFRFDSILGHPIGLKAKPPLKRFHLFFICSWLFKSKQLVSLTRFTHKIYRLFESSFCGFLMMGFAEDNGGLTYWLCGVLSSLFLD